jgi:hypothetical protein
MTVPKTNDIEVAESIVVQNEIVVGLVRSLEEVKNPSSAAKLATKHALLITVVNNTTGTMCHVDKKLKL